MILVVEIAAKSTRDSIKENPSMQVRFLCESQTCKTMEKDKSFEGLWASINLLISFWVSVLLIGMPAHYVLSNTTNEEIALIPALLLSIFGTFILFLLLQIWDKVQELNKE